MNDGCKCCAYAVMEDGKPVWCKFHDLEVTEKNTCDDYLDFMDAPYMDELIENARDDQSEPIKAEVRVNNRIKDILAWVIIAVIIIAAILTFLFL